MRRCTRRPLTERERLNLEKMLTEVNKLQVALKDLGEIPDELSEWKNKPEWKIMESTLEGTSANLRSLNKDFQKRVPHIVKLKENIERTLKEGDVTNSRIQAINAGWRKAESLIVAVNVLFR